MQISGLVNRPELNGAFGRVNGHVAATGRHQVGPRLAASPPFLLLSTPSAHLSAPPPPQQVELDNSAAAGRALVSLKADNLSIVPELRVAPERSAEPPGPHGVPLLLVDTIDSELDEMRLGFSSLGACCATCGQANGPLKDCANCHGAVKYCSRECQRDGWGRGQRRSCGQGLPTPMRVAEADPLLLLNLLSEFGCANRHLACASLMRIVPIEDDFVGRRN